MKSWQKKLTDRNRWLEDENMRLEIQLREQEKRLHILDRIANAPPTIMIACEHIVDAAAHQVSDMLQMMKEARR